MNVSLYKYKTSNPLFKNLVKNYFKAVASLYQIISSEVSSALEIGSGEGFSTKEILKFLNSDTRFKAFEPSEKSVEMALELNPDVTFINQELHQIDSSVYKSDLVFLLEVLEHLDNPVSALHKLSNISSKYLIIGVPNEPIWRICNFIRLSYVKQLGNTPGHVNHWNARSLSTLVEANYGPVIKLYSPFPWIVLLAKNSKQ